MLRTPASCCSYEATLVRIISDGFPTQHEVAFNIVAIIIMIVLDFPCSLNLKLSYSFGIFEALQGFFGHFSDVFICVSLSSASLSLQCQLNTSFFPRVCSQKLQNTLCSALVPSFFPQLQIYLTFSSISKTQYVYYYQQIFLLSILQV